MNTGYIRIYRKMLENPIIMKDSDHLAVWIYLLLSATHKGKRVLFGKEEIVLNCGELITGKKQISEKLGISESKVGRILKLFESEQQIEQLTNSQGRLISIKNWCMYQNVNNDLNNKWTTSEQQVNTNNNVIMKECNIERNNNARAHTRKVFDYDWLDDENESEDE